MMAFDVYIRSAEILVRILQSIVLFFHVGNNIIYDATESKPCI